ncbi:leucine-rich repeat receptor-like protein kinase PEPR1 [Branchiostoma floridae]|uniref:Leucine-rich repeat protein SHOC-2 n=1 Tax=Branchiostoma floridae TaxID=7739 RepID=A0A9J7KLK5_BRAFL|nr:leucine-rich repeat receptor-like protein kinase PEPR1 [Branchiostoma floridae]
MAAGLNLQPQTVNGRLKLDLSNQDLTSIPEEVFDITDLEFLDVSNNKLSSIPEAIGRLQKLYRLDADGNMLKSLPQAIGSLQKLTHLYVYRNKLANLPPGIEKLQKLTLLSIFDNQLTKVPPGVCMLPSLEVLDASNNKLSTFPPGVEKLQKLRELGIDGNQLTEVPPGVFLLPNLEVLDVSVCSLPNLEVLNVDNNNLSAFPPGVEKLQKLRGLGINDNQLTEVPSGVCSLPNLEALGVGNNKLSTFPPGVEKLQKLRVLHIYGNQLTEVPSGVCSLPNLELLNVSNNPIRRLPNDVTRLTRLKNLDVHCCQFDEFPRQVLQLKTLEKLYAGQSVGRKFDMVPDEVGNLQHLWYLALENNLLRTLPSTMSRLHNLREVHLWNNKFDTFPEVLCELPAMEKLDISNNNITRLPTALHRADKLKDLDVSGNPLTYPPQDVCEQGTGAIMAFLKQEAEKDERILRAFNRLSARMSQTQWKPLARSLGLSNRAVDAIKASAPDDVPDQVYQTLVQWKEKEGEAATLSALEQHLRDLDFQQLADQLTPRTPDRRGHDTGAVGAVGGQEADGLQSSARKYPSVTVDQKFPIINFERLEEQSILGRGGFAYVMQARHLDWKQDVAVKYLLTRQIEGSEQEVLYSEARKLKLASNSVHVISLLGVCLDPNFAIVMPFMENGSLAGLLRDVDVPWALRWRMAHEISLGMTFLHCQNPQILHCDLKAENVLLDGDFHVKISDFGLSKWKIESRVVTQTSPEGSTITHAPPEYFMDINLVPTEKFDVYSFGVLLWEIVTRTGPYGNAVNSALIRLAVTSGQRPDLTLIPTDREDVTSVSQLMQTCWSQNPEDRPSFDDCADRLRHVKDRFSREEVRQAIIIVEKMKVHFWNNKFDTFPEVLCELPAMEKLDIRNNNITRLPIALHRADKLKDLDVSGNPLTYPPRDVCKQGTGAIMAFLKQEAEKDERILRAFNRLSVRMSQTQWKPLARSLGLSNRAMDAIKASAPDDVPDQVYQTLVQWRAKAGEAATLSALEQHLRDLDFQQLADQLSPTHRMPVLEDLDQPSVLLVVKRLIYPSVTIDRRFPIVESGRLEEQSILGRGGFAFVTKARHLDWRQDVAVKCLLTRKLEGSEQELLYSEARKLNLGSRSDHVISLLGVCLDPNFAIVMPYMENGSLAGLLRDVDVPWALRWRMAHEISLGMTFLHCQNPQILHCDLKAENVLLDGDFHVKISDFGLSKWKAESRVVTKTSPEGSTITHAPPEYHSNINLAPNTKFDVYSFGVLLWEIVTRRQPYALAANSALISMAVTMGQRPDLTLIPTDREDVTSVSQLMQTCWSQDPEDRPTFDDCADRLRHVQDRFSREEIRQAIITVEKMKAAASRK